MLREYQVEAVRELRLAVKNGSKAPLLQMGTGLGKTICIGEIIRSATEKNRHALVLVPRRQLVYQTLDKLAMFDVEAGIIMAGERPSLMPQVQVASVQTLYRRYFEDGEAKEGLPRADVIVLDEAHANFSTMAKTILSAYPQAVKIGMTATPRRTQGEGLGEIYDAIVSGPSVRWAMDNGYLSELRYFGPSEWDMSGVQIQAGDYNQKQLGEKVNTAGLIGDVVENWINIGYGRTTVVFAVDRKHARALHDAFSVAGIAAEYIDGQTPNDERKGIFERLENGQSQVLCSVAVVDMGWDMPCASCAVLARPTKSVTRYLQAVGRILRPAPGKEDSILIDHTGAVHELGFVDDDFGWSLEGSAKRERSKTGSKADEIKSITCPECKRVIRPARICPECGHSLAYTARRAIVAKEARLKEIARAEKKRNARIWSQNEKARFFGELKYHAREKGYKPGWAVNQYKSRIGVLPWPVYNTQPVPPSAETRAWIRHKQIQWAKRRTASTTPP